MSDSIRLILIPLAVALAVWGIAQAVLSALKSDKRRLQDRLQNGPSASMAPKATSFTLATQPAGISQRLAQWRVFRGLARTLAQACPDFSLAKFLMVQALVSLVACAVLVLVAESVLVALVAAAAGAFLPLLLVNRKRDRRQRKIATQIPEALDFLSRILRAGHSFSTGLQMMGEELAEPIAGEFRRAYDQHSLGQSIDDVLRNTAERIDSRDFAFFVTAVLIQRQTGGDLAGVLGNISTMIRQRVRLQQHVRAITAEGRLTSYVLLAFPPVLFAISYALNPAYAGQLLHTDGGQLLLGFAVALQMAGLYVIRRIVTVRL